MAFIENTGLERLWGHIVHRLSQKADKEDLKILSKTVDEIPQADWNQNDETAKDYIKNRPFGETTVMGDTLTWDGNTEGLTIVNDSMPIMGYLVSNVAPTFEQLKNGVTIVKKNFNGDEIERLEFSYEEIMEEYAPESDQIILGQVFIQMNDLYYTDSDLVDGEWVHSENVSPKGMWLHVDYEFENYIAEVQIHGAKLFETTEIKKIPVEYLPDGVPYEEENTVDITGMEYVVNLQGDHNGIDGLVNSHNLNLPFALGQKWKCIPIQNGTIEREEYIVELDIAQSDDGALYLGDVDPNGPERVLDFRIDVNTCVGNNSAMTRGGIRHVKIIGISGTYSTGTTVHQLDPKYIKDMYYTGDIVETFIVEETNITLEEGGDNTGLITASQPLEVGQEYTITIDGTQYNSVCNSVNVDGVGNIPYIGNLVLIGRSEDTSEPFFIAPMNSETELGIINDTGALEYTVSVVKIVSEIHHLDPKYIPDSVKVHDWNTLENRPFGEEIGWVAIVEEQTVTLDSNGHGTVVPVDNLYELVHSGDQYTVKFDGVAYNGVVYEDGDACLRTDFTTESGVKVWMYDCSEIASSSEIAGEHTIEIGIISNVVTQIDNKYIDFPITSVNGKTGDVYLSAADIGAVEKSALDEKMDKTNPTGTGSFSVNRKAGTNIGEYSFASGYNTEASGDYSYAEGRDTKAIGDYSHAEGNGTTATGEYQHVQGFLNVKDTEKKYLHIVGNGSNQGGGVYYHSNAHTIDWNGNAWFQGDVYVGSTSGKNRDEGSKKLATEEYVENAVTSAGGGAVFTVNITTNEDGSCSADKTFDEIVEAHESGKVVKCNEDSLGFLLDVSIVTSDVIAFVNSAHNIDNGIYINQIYCYITSENIIVRNHKKFDTGDMTSLTTEDKTIVGAINELNAKHTEGTDALILSSPNGTRFNITVGDDGILSATEITE